MRLICCLTGTTAGEGLVDVVLVPSLVAGSVFVLVVQVQFTDTFLLLVTCNSDTCVSAFSF